MIRQKMTFAGVDFGAQFHAYLAKSNFLDGASKDVESVQVVGRSGNLQISNDRYNNITLKVYLYVTDNMKENVDAMRNFLESCHGYKRYEETLNPNEYRMASYKQAFVPDVYDVNAGAITLEFDAMPQRFLNSGTVPVDASRVQNTYTGNPVSIDNPSGISSVSSLAVALEPIQTGTGDPSPTNIRPITGHTSASVTRTGKNQFNGQFAYHNADKYSPVVSGNTYTVSSKSTGAHQINMQYITNTNTYYGDSKIVSEGDTFGKTTVTIPTDVKGVLIYVNGDASNSQHTAYDTQIELGSTATEYEPYTTASYSSNLGRLVYGGTVDLATGVLTVDRVSVDMGSLTWTYESATNCMITPALSGLKLPTSDNVAVDAITAVAKIIPASQRVQVSGVRAYVFTGNRQMLFRDTGYTDASAFKTAMNGNNIVYALETPQTVQLTAQQISLLTGINYISSSDEVTVTVSEPSLLENPTLFDSKPLIRVYGHGTLTVNNQYITIAENPYEYIDIDCDIMDAFYGANNANQYVTLPDDYVTLHSGNNYIAYDGTAEITPRWYEV